MWQMLKFRMRVLMQPVLKIVFLMLKMEIVKLIKNGGRKTVLLLMACVKKNKRK